MYICESIMYKISEALNIDIDELRLRNLYKVGQKTPFLQEITDDFHIPTMVEQISTTSDFERRKAAVKEFNAKNRFKKRGICRIPSKFGLRCVLLPFTSFHSQISPIDSPQLRDCPAPEPGCSLCQNIRGWFCASPPWRNRDGSGSIHQDVSSCS